MPATVDVAIPVYERSTFVAEAVRSVLAQTRGDWRLTVSEDGPGNGAVRAAVEPFLDDPRISHVTTGTRVGLAAHKTRLIRTGSAPYVAILDDDDLWDEEWLARRVEFLERHPECGFVFSEHLDIDDGGTVIGETPFLFPEGVLSRETFMRTCMQRNVVGTPTMLVRRTAYEACGDAFDTRFPRICDYEVALATYDGGSRPSPVSHTAKPALRLPVTGSSLMPMPGQKARTSTSAICAPATPATGSTPSACRCATTAAWTSCGSSITSTRSSSSTCRSCA